MLSKDYIIGLVDGEGSFTVYLRDTGRYREAECHFYIKLRKEDLPLLKKVQKFFGCGYIAFQLDRRPNHSDCYRYEVGNLQDLQKKIIP